HVNSLTFSSIILCQVDTTTDRRGGGRWPASGQNYQNPICEATFCRLKIFSLRQHSRDLVGPVSAAAGIITLFVGGCGGGCHGRAALGAANRGDRTLPCDGGAGTGQGAAGAGLRCHSYG